MSKKFYVVCDDNCRIEGMSREQISEMLSKNIISTRFEDGVLYLETGGSPIPDDGSGFITTLKELNAGKGVSLWVGTEAEFNAISPAVDADSFLARVDKNGRVYICTNDSFMELLKKTIHADHITIGEFDIDERLADVLTSNQYMAGSLRQTRDADADFVGKPVQVCYQTANPPTLAAGSQLAIWEDKGNGLAEIQPISLQAVKNFFTRNDFAHTASSSETILVILNRNIASRFLVITLVKTVSATMDGDSFKTFFVDWSAVSRSGKSTHIVGDADAFVTISKESGKVTFFLSGTDTGVTEFAYHFESICGYY